MTTNQYREIGIKKSNPVEVKKEKNTKQSQLILFNDDVNSFEFVIESLIKICKHNAEQAEQCAWITHFRGKCAIKVGAREELTPISVALLTRGLTVEIE